jgi:hypothetical protein
MLPVNAGSTYWRTYRYTKYTAVVSRGANSAKGSGAKPASFGRPVHFGYKLR